MLANPIGTIQLMNAAANGNRPTVYFTRTNAFSAKLSINPAMDLLQQNVFDKKSKNKKSKITSISKNIRKYPTQEKHKRTYIVPDNINRCVAITKNKEQCKCSKITNSDYCYTHSKIYNDEMPIPYEDQSETETETETETIQPKTETETIQPKTETPETEKKTN